MHTMCLFVLNTTCLYELTIIFVANKAKNKKRSSFALRAAAAAATATAFETWESIRGCAFKRLQSFLIEQLLSTKRQACSQLQHSSPLVSVSFAVPLMRPLTLYFVTRVRRGIFFFF